MAFPVYEALDVPNPFEQPGLSEDLLLEILDEAQSLRAEATALDAPTRGGSEAYFHQVVGLRRGLIPFDWTYSNKSNFCTVKSPDERHVIAVAQGTWGTGLVNGSPETVRPLGPTIANAINANIDQLSLWGAASLEATEHPLTWVLLSHRRGRVTYSELALPEVRTEEGYIVQWRQRWILSELDSNTPPVRRRPRMDDELDAEPIVVPVSLKVK